jgi:hypothetical protein
MIAWILAAMIGLAAGFVGLVAADVIGIRYPLVVENRALLHPQHVRGVIGAHLLLEDGRDIAIVDASRLFELELPRTIASSDNLVDVEPYGDGYEVFTSQPLGLGCGSPWMKPIQIPLIADRIEANYRASLGHGVLSSKAARAAASAAR